MTDEHKRPGVSAKEIRALAAETGVSEDDIRLIVQMVGTDRASIIREARYLKSTR